MKDLSHLLKRVKVKYCILTGLLFMLRFSEFVLAQLGTASLSLAFAVESPAELV